MLQVVISLAIVVGIFWYVLEQFADISEVWDAMRTLTWREVVVLVVAATWNLATYWILTVIATPGLRYPQAVVLTETTTAVSNALPAGGALGVGLTYTILSSWGFSKSRSTLSVVVTGIWNNFAKLGLPIVALAILAVQGQPGGGRMFAAAAGLAELVGAVVVFALILSSEQYARRVGLFAERLATRLRRLLRRGPVRGWDAVVRFRDRVIGLVRRRWVALTAATIVGHLSLYTDCCSPPSGSWACRTQTWAGGAEHRRVRLRPAADLHPAPRPAAWASSVGAHRLADRHRGRRRRGGCLGADLPPAHLRPAHPLRCHHLPLLAAQPLVKATKRRRCPPSWLPRRA